MLICLGIAREEFPVGKIKSSKNCEENGTGKVKWEVKLGKKGIRFVDLAHRQVEVATHLLI